MWIVAVLVIASHAIAQPSPPATQEQEPPAPTAAHRNAGMDETVNVKLAKEAGAPVRKPFIDVESLGDLWNLLLLGAGAVCGFVVGRYWDQIWGRPK
jgi:hypothetical protein